MLRYMQMRAGFTDQRDQELPSSENYGNWYHLHALDAPLKVIL